MSAVYTLSATSGVAILIAIAIICCKKNTSQARPIPLPSDYVPNIFSSMPEQSEILPRATLANNQYYQLIREGDIQSFKICMRLFDEDTLEAYFINNASTHLDPGDENTNLNNEPLLLVDLKGVIYEERRSYSIFQIILKQKDETNKIKFLRALLEKMKDHRIKEENDIYLAEFLKIQDAEMIDLLFKKLDIDAICLTLGLAFLGPNEGPSRAWANAFFEKRLHSDISETPNNKNWLIEMILISNFETNLKLEYLGTCLKKNVSFETFVLNDYIWLFKNKRPFQCNLLHAAISCGEIELAKKFASYPSLIDKPAISQETQITPLMLAIMRSNLEVVQVLLNAGANPNVTLNVEECFFQAGLNSTHVTPLIMARHLGCEGIIQALIQAGEL